MSDPLSVPKARVLATLLDGGKVVRSRMDGDWMRLPGRRNDGEELDRRTLTALLRGGFVLLDVKDGGVSVARLTREGQRAARVARAALRESGFWAT